VANGREYTEETKAAVMAALLAGQSINHVANEYKIPRGTVASWSRNLPRNQTVSIEKRERIGDLIIDNLEAELETTIAMQNVFTDEKWLRRQRASELAVLYGVIKDKTMRVLEALPDDADGEAAIVS
jgi:transposase-like protein